MNSKQPLTIGASRTLTTNELATALGLEPQSIRKRHSQTGEYYGVRPIIRPNGRLSWPCDAVEQLNKAEGRLSRTKSPPSPIASATLDIVTDPVPSLSKDAIGTATKPIISTRLPKRLAPVRNKPDLAKRPDDPSQSQSDTPIEPGFAVSSIDTVRKILEEKARSKILWVFYKDVMTPINLNPKVDTDLHEFEKILEEVSRKSYAEKKILLSVLVHERAFARTRPSPNFFNLARSLGYKFTDSDRFTEDETERVFTAFDQIPIAPRSATSTDSPSYFKDLLDGPPRRRAFPPPPARTKADNSSQTKTGEPSESPITNKVPENASTDDASPSLDGSLPET